MNNSTKEITYIGLGLAGMIVGGFAIYQVSAVLPIPGVKYILMAPVLSMVLYLLVNLLNTKNVILKTGLVFTVIMSIINVYMGLSILIATCGAHLCQVLFKRASFGAIAFSFFTGVGALLVSKYLIGGVFTRITLAWILVTGCLCGFVGAYGVYVGKKILSRIKIDLEKNI